MSLLSGLGNPEDPADWKLANNALIFKKGKKDDAESDRLVSLTPVPGKVM